MGRLLVPAYTVRSKRRLIPGASVRFRVRGRKAPESGIVLRSNGGGEYVVMRRRNATEYLDVVQTGVGSTRVGRAWKSGMRRILFPQGSRATKIIVTALGAAAGMSVGPAGALAAGVVMLGIAEGLDYVTSAGPRSNPRRNGHEFVHGQHFDYLFPDPPGAYAVEQAAHDEAAAIRGEGSATRLKRVRADAKALGLLAAYERGARRGFAEARRPNRRKGAR